jgi:methionyl-tRNA formyltransferase
MNTLFIGSTKRGFRTLQALLKRKVPVVGVLSLAQDEHELDRYEGPIKDLALAHGIPVRETKFIRDGALSRWATQNLKAETAIGVGVRILLPEEFYTVFPHGCWGVHDSLLPEYRGFAPLNWSIINDEPRTGVSLFRICNRMDGGDILVQQEVPIGPTETAPEVYERVCDATVAVVLEGYRRLAEGRATPAPQDYAAGSFTCARTPVDGQIDWAQPSRRIFNLIRALTFPYPGAYTHYRGRRLYVLGAEEIPQPPRYAGRIPGRVTRLVAGTGVEVLTGDGLLRITRVSTDGRTVQRADEVVRSVKSSLGLALVDLADKLAELERRMEAMTAHAIR